MHMHYINTMPFLDNGNVSVQRKKGRRIAAPPPTHEPKPTYFYDGQQPILTIANLL